MSENKPVQFDNSPRSIVIATKNLGKAKEFESMFREKNIQVKTLLDFPKIPDIEETGHTFEENACLKAETLCNVLQIPVLSDDSGLMVDALNGDPGVYSARYAGEDKNDDLNNEKLLVQLHNVPQYKRTAKFVCVIALAFPDKPTIIAKGEVKGIINEAPRGKNGFGYDPLFFLPEKSKTMAELTPEIKNKVSHRYNALQKLRRELNF